MRRIRDIHHAETSPFICNIGVISLQRDFPGSTHGIMVPHFYRISWIGDVHRPQPQTIVGYISEVAKQLNVAGNAGCIVESFKVWSSRISDIDHVQASGANRRLTVSWRRTGSITRW